MFIPGIITSLLTFPGIIIHEIAHRFFCDLAKVPVYEICYIRFEDPMGYVVHGPIEDIRHAFLISVGPMIINTVLCSLLTFPVVFPMLSLGAFPSASDMLLLWLGISMGMHAFPSETDMYALDEQCIQQKQASIWLFLSKIFGFVFALARLLSVVWFDAIYAFGVSILLPLLIMQSYGLTPHEGWLDWTWMVFDFFSRD